MELRDQDILAVDYDHKAGGIKIKLDRFGFKGETLGVWHNYLGGGMVGRLCSGNSIQRPNKPFVDEETAQKLDELAEELKRHYFFTLNPEASEEHFKKHQQMPVSAY